MWAIYKNGNSIVKINLANGSKIRETEDDDFNLEFPESIDINIGNRCDGGCPFCYINASPDGINGELLNIPFINTIRPYTEVAINGNSVDHPQLYDFLSLLKEKKIIANITVNQIHFERKESIIRDLVDKKLIYGLGISLRESTPEFIERVKKFPNAVLHTINGILSPSDIEILRDNDLKILILGYKNLGRGAKYNQDNELKIKYNQKYLYDHLESMLNHFKLISFDNLALQQLDVRRLLTNEEWESFFMGRDGTSSMFIDLVTNKFGISSLCKPEEMHPIMDDIVSMFKIIKESR